MDILLKLAERAVGGHGAAVWLEGEPGIGKTALLEALAAELGQRGLRVVTGHGNQLAKEMLFTTLGTCLRQQTANTPEATRLGLLLDTKDSDKHVSAEHYGFVVSEAVLDMFETWCSQGAVALIVDDAQWIDAASAAALQRLMRGISHLPLMMMFGATQTIDDHGAATATALRADASLRIPLSPLTPEDVGILATNILGAPPGPGLRLLLEHAGGNPLFVTEVLTDLAQHGQIAVAGLAELVDPTGHHMPPSLAEAITRHFTSLPAESRHALQIAAVLGQSVDVEELALVLELPMSTLSQIVLQAVDCHWLLSTGPRLRFRHEVVRLALREKVPPALRVSLHRRAAQLLIAADADADRVAEHLLSGDFTDAMTARWLTREADALITRSPKRTRNLIEKALVAADPETQRPLRRQLVQVLLWEGCWEHAEHIARGALATDHDPVDEGPLRWHLMDAIYRQGRLPDAIHVADEALASPHLTDAQKARFHGFSALCHMFGGQADPCRAAAEKAVAGGEGSWDEIAVGYGYECLATLRYMDNEPEDALQLINRAAAAFQGSRPDLPMATYAVQSLILAALGRFAEADKALEDAVLQSQQAGGVYLTYIYFIRATLRYHDGRWDDALAELRAAADARDPLNQTTGLQGLAALIDLHRGRETEAVQQLLDPGDAGPGNFDFPMRWTQALHLERQAGPRRALTTLHPVWQRAGGLTPAGLVYSLCPDLARMAIDASRHELARRLADDLESLAGGRQPDSVTGVSSFCRGLANDNPELLAAAAQSFRQAGWPLFEAQALEETAVALARGGHVPKAREALRDALEIFDRLEATWDIARVTSRMREYGIRVGVRGRRQRPKHGWNALTATEQQVALQVAKGLSNADIAARMYLSRRTIQTHVSSILAKLGMSSRVQVAIEAAALPMRSDD